MATNTQLITRNAPTSPSLLKATFAIVQKDLAAEFRSFELVSAMLVFSLLVIIIFNFALELDVKVRESVTAGILWTTFAFAGTLGLNRSMSTEKDRGCMDGLLLAPVDRSAIYFGKVISNLAFMLIVYAIPQGIVGLIERLAKRNGGAA
jgi:heme exporter protein B